MRAEKQSEMQPSLGDSYITLPITFDYHGGRKDTVKSKRVWACIIGVVCLIISVGILFSKEMPMWKSFPVFLLFSAGYIFGIRYLLLDEKKVKSDYKSIMDRDMKLDDSVIWGIYDIENKYPYICRYRNGKSGIFVGLNKDVILGKYDESEFEHYEAIGDAYNLAGASKVQIIHIDYMDNVGTDDRIEESFASLADVSNPDLKSILTDVYSYQQEQMMKNVTTFDVYAFLWTGSDASAWNDIQRILSCFLDANYRSYHVLNSHDLRELTKVVMNLEEFSVIKASSVAFETANNNSITPILFVDQYGNKTKLGKTKEERQQEAKQREEEQLALDQEKQRRKRTKSRGNKQSTESDLIDIFEE